MHLKRQAVPVLWVFLLGMMAEQAEATPAFARKFNVSCVTCHTAWPLLNKTGRTFKERGYRMPDEEGNITPETQNRQNISDSLVLEKMLPLAIRAQSIPADVMPQNSDGSGAQYQLQPISDINLLAIGNAFSYGSFFVSAEASGAGNAFGFGLVARLGVHPFEYFNIIGGYAPIFSTDPYPSLQSVDDPISIHKKLVLDIPFLNTTEFDNPSPFITIYGRRGPVYYSASLTDGTNNLAAVNPRVGAGRIAVDVTDTLEIGAFALGGVAPYANNPDTTIWLAGVDSNLSTQSYVLSLIGRAAGGQGVSNGSDTNWGASAEFMYIIQMKGQPHLLPVSRIEWLQANSAGANQVRAFLGLSAFVRQNIRVGIDGSVDLKAMDATPTFWRGTLYADLVF